MTEDTSLTVKFDSLVEEIEKAEKQTVTEDSPAEQPKESILVVDDDKTQIYSIKKILENDYYLFLAENGEEAVKLYRLYKAQIKAILLDIRLPGIDGFEVFERLKELNNNIPIIFITGYQQKYGDGYEIYRKYRPHGYIVKNSENETAMIRDTLAAAVASYNSITTLEKEKERKLVMDTMSGLIHDLKNMFVSISLTPRVISDLLSAGNYDTALSYIKDISNSFAMYAYLQEVMFNFSKGIKVKPSYKPCNIAEAINEFIKISSIQFQENMKIQTIINYYKPFTTDKTILLFQVVLNIVKNAYEAFKNKDGVVTIEAFPFAEYSQQYQEKAKFVKKNPDDLILLISDNGPGIPEEFLPYVFEPYQTTGKEDGTGLGGWMILNGVRDLLNGDLYLENKIGQGVTYHIWLPKI